MIEQIKDIKVPTNVEMNEMSVDQLIEWREKLRPFYKVRVQILDQLDYSQYVKANRFRSFEKMVWNLQNGIPRWQGISNYDENKTRQPV